MSGLSPETIARTLTSNALDNEAARLLDRAADVVERGWCRGANARTALDEPTTIESPAAAAWCAHGGLQRAGLSVGVLRQFADGLAYVGEQDRGCVLSAPLRVRHVDAANGDAALLHLHRTAMGWNRP